MVNSNRSNSPPLSEKKFMETFYSEVVFACRRCLFTTEQTSQNKRSSNMHAACARHSWIDSSPCFVFLCGKRELSFCSDSRRVFGFLTCQTLDAELSRPLRR